MSTDRDIYLIHKLLDIRTPPVVSKGGRIIFFLLHRGLMNSIDPEVIVGRDGQS